MKLAELGLKTKPATKYFAGGWISFSTQNKELYYKIVLSTIRKQFTLDEGKVADKSHLTVLLTIRDYHQATELLNQ